MLGLSAVLTERALEATFPLARPDLRAAITVPLGVLVLVAFAQVSTEGVLGVAADFSLADAGLGFQLQMLVLLAVVFPVVEEALFRGLVFGYVFDHTDSLWVAVAASAVGFGLIHLGYGPVGVATRTLAACVYLSQRIVHDSITEPALTHALYNTVVFLGLVGVL